MKKLFFIFGVSTFLICCSTSYVQKDIKHITIGEFTTCMNTCKISMKKNLKGFDFSSKEIQYFNVDKKCVSFCVEYLKRKKGIVTSSN